MLPACFVRNDVQEASAAQQEASVERFTILSLSGRGRRYARWLNVFLDA